MNLQMLKAMMHSPVRNYVIPGLTSWLVGNPSPAGTVRVFECSRAHQEVITPHSHRFNFQCWVLAGSVRNRVWTRAYGDGDEFAVTSLDYLGKCGEYTTEDKGVEAYRFEDTTYGTDEWYSMNGSEIHSIYFSRGAKVLFLEGPQTFDQSVILEPWVDGKKVPTFKVEDWMFRREPA